VPTTLPRASVRREPPIDTGYSTLEVDGEISRERTKAPELLLRAASAQQTKPRVQVSPESLNLAYLRGFLMG